MQADPIRVFWVPGGSACIRVKELLTGLGVPFESVNLLNNPQGSADLAKLRARSLPIVARGQDFVFAESLDQVAKFVGKRQPRRRSLPPAELIVRWQEFLTIARSLAGQIPAGKLLQRPVPDRDRTLLGLAFHIFQVPDAFLRNVAGEFEDWAHYVNLPPPAQMKTANDVIRFGEGISAALDEWWAALEERDCRWTVRTYYGVRPAWELLERQTWHSAQHTRQLQAALEGFGIDLERSAPPALYKGLPMPEGLWQ